jgi:hypothetical protein
MDSAPTWEKFAPKSTTKLIAAAMTGKKRLFFKDRSARLNLGADKG